MVKRVQREVPAGEIEEAGDAIGRVVEIFQINRQVDKDANDFGLGPNEVDELRDAYVLESTYGAGVHQFRYLRNLFPNDRKLRSSQEILEAADLRKQQQDQVNFDEQQNSNDASSPLPDIRIEGPSVDSDPTTIPPGAPQPSILDYLNDAVGKAGAVVSTVGYATFDMAANLGKETLNQMIQLALTGGAGGKDMMKQAMRLAMGNMMANMQAQMIADIEKGLSGGGGIGMTVFNPVPVFMPEDVRRPVEDMMNSPRNEGLFDVLADQIMQMLGIGFSGDAVSIVMNTLVEEVKRGGVALPGDILLPDFPAKEEMGGPAITIFGVPIGVQYPGVIHENPDAVGGGKRYSFTRNGEGKVVVKAHTRAGHAVKEYTRGAPDGDETNNLSYKHKV